MILRMDHFTIVTNQLEATRDFYVEVLGLVERATPALPGSRLLAVRPATARTACGGRITNAGAATWRARPYGVSCPGLAENVDAPG